MNSVTVRTASKKYSVHSGENLIRYAGALAASAVGVGQALIVTDTNAGPLYGETLMNALTGSGFDARMFMIPAGEQSKNMNWLSAILNHMAQSRMTREDTVFALGGGVIGDMAGLAASLYMRGISLVQVPTSLLASVDSSVGGKTAIDLEAGKNLVGSFFQPDLVLCDTASFKTLPPEHIANGFGEIVKTGVIRDEKLFEMSAAPQISNITAIVHRCVEIKSDVVCHDEKETGLRQILNFGHTFGHAVEKCSNFAIPHGFCVAIGMAIITAASVKRGICGQETLTRLLSALNARGLPHTTHYRVEDLYDSMMSDKKRARHPQGSNTVTLVLPLSIGSVERRRVAMEEARSFMVEGLAALEELERE